MEAQLGALSPIEQGQSAATCSCTRPIALVNSFLSFIAQILPLLLLLALYN